MKILEANQFTVMEIAEILKSLETVFLSGGGWKKSLSLSEVPEGTLVSGSSRQCAHDLK